MKYKFIFLFLFIPFLSFLPVENIKKMQVDMQTRTLAGNQYVNLKSTLYFDILKETMVTHATTPFEQVAFNYANGDMKVYNVKTNMVAVESGLDVSSRNSFFYNFLYGNTNDLGLKKLGFKIISTKIEDKTVIVTTWEPIQKSSKGVQKAVLAHENNLPIYMSFTNEKKLTFLKIYYSDFEKVNNTFLPSLMTEIQFESAKDSVIMRRNFTNFKTNEQCDETYFNYQIPSSAKLIQPDTK